MDNSTIFVDNPTVVVDTFGGKEYSPQLFLLSRSHRTQIEK
jgi:hypothetical protein